MPTFHGKINGCYGAISVAPIPAISGQVFTFDPVGGATFPALPFVLTVWPSTGGPLNSNMEIILVTAVTGFQVTACTRAYEGSAPRAIAVGDQAANTITAGDIEEIQDAIDTGGIPWVAAPASASSTGTTGAVAYDDSYFYVCTATDTWTRAPLSSW